MATTSLSISGIQGYVNGSTSSHQWFGSERGAGNYYVLRLQVTLPKGKDYSISFSITGRNDYGGSAMASGKQYNIGISESHNSTYASGSSSTYSSSFTTTSQISSGGSYTGTATISYNKTLTSDTNLYIYVWGNNPSNVYSLLTYVSASISVTYTSTTACGAPTSVRASGIVAPNGSFTVSWSGASSGTNNLISSYQIYWYISSGGTAPSTSSYSGTKNIKSTSTDGTTTITLSKATRGYKVVCGVVTRGSAGPSYYSSIKTGGSVTINSLPSLSTITQSATNVKSGTSVTFSVSVADSNSSSQTLKYGYKLSTDSNYTYVDSGTNISFTKASGSYTVDFIPYDGLETGAISSKSFTVNKPSGSITVRANDSIYYTISTYPITKKISCSASYANGASGVRYYYRTGSTSSLSGNGTLIGTNAPTQVPRGVSDGNYYQIGIIPFNSLENGNIVWSDIFIKPTAPTAPSSLLVNASGFSSLTAFYNKKIDVRWNITPSTGSKKQSPLIKTYLKYTYGSNTSIINNSSTTGSPISGTSFNKTNLSLSSGINRGGTVTIEAIVEDAAGQIASCSTTITRINLPSFINTTGASVSPTSIKPYSINSEQLIFRIPKATSDFEQDIKLEISTTDNSSSTQILTGNSLIAQEENTSNSPTTSWENESTFKISFNLNSLKNFFINLDSSSISKYSKTFLIRAVDAFGNYSSNNINLSYTLDYREAPIASSDYFKIGVDKSFKLGNIHNCDASNIFPGLNIDNTDNYRIINPNEKFVFAYPVFSSKNPNESITLYIQYSYGKNAADIPKSGWSNLVSFSYGSDDLLRSLCSVNSASIYNNLRAYSIPNTINGFKYVFFRMYAKSSSGLNSKTSDFDYCLYCSQSNFPTIEIDRLSISEDTITINYKNLIYGGNTNSLKNYERTYLEKEGTYTPSLKITPFLNSDSNFDPKTNISYEIQNSSSTNYIEFTSDFNSLKSGEIKVKLLSGTELTRIYIKLNISVTTGLSSSGTTLIKANDSTLSVFYSRVPTISRRANQIGINTKSFNEDDAILIENYEGKQYIRLKGTARAIGEEDPIIIIDLNSSSISGITIDCGAW